MASIVLPFTLSDDLRRRLEELAQRDEQLASRFVELVLREALDYEDAMKQSIDRGLADIEAGRTMTNEELARRIDERIASTPDKR